MVGLTKKAVPYTNFICGGDSFATPVEYSVTGTGTGNYIVKRVLDTLEVGSTRTGLALIWDFITAIMKADTPQRAYLGYAVRDKTKKASPPSVGDTITITQGRQMGTLSTTPIAVFVNNDMEEIYVGESDDYGNTIADGDQIVIDILFLQRDASAGTNNITLYCYQHEIPYCIR